LYFVKIICLAEVVVAVVILLAEVAGGVVIPTWEIYAFSAMAVVLLFVQVVVEREVLMFNQLPSRHTNKPILKKLVAAIAVMVTKIVIYVMALEYVKHVVEMDGNTIHSD
jgi:hypothetical protein